jgi:hypothetical protein
MRWGDGTSSPAFVDQEKGSGSFAGPHVYADDGTYSVSVEVVDDNGSVTQTTTTSVITNVAPTAAAVSDMVIEEGAVVECSCVIYAPRISEHAPPRVLVGIAGGRVGDAALCGLGVW